MGALNISVIIPVYNVQPYLQRAIDSVLIQPEVKEVILVDDGSSDNSLSICYDNKQKDARIKVYTHKSNQNKGVSATRNLGIKKATNDYIAFLDADDYYLRERFKETKKVFEDETIDSVYEMTGTSNSLPGIKNYSVIERVSAGVLFENIIPLGAKVYFHINGLTVKRCAFSKNLFFDESMKTSEDTLQWFKMAAKLRLLSGSKLPVAVRQKTSDGLSSNKTQVIEDERKLFFKLFKWCAKNKCDHSRKEHILKKIFDTIFYNSYANPAIKYYALMSAFVKVTLADPRFVVLNSKTGRIVIGTLTGYNFMLVHSQKMKNSNEIFNG